MQHGTVVSHQLIFNMVAEVLSFWGFVVRFIKIFLSKVYKDIFDNIEQLNLFSNESEVKQQSHEASGH